MILRPLIFAILEYFLALVVLKKGKFEPKSISLFLFFLGSYQLGEAITLLSEYDTLGLNISYASATLLPAFGIYFIEKITKKNLYSIIFFTFAIFLSLVIFIYPNALIFNEEFSCLLKIISSQNTQEFFYFWSIYYFSVLILGILIAIYSFFKTKENVQKKMLLSLLISYIAFFPTGVLLVLIFGLELSYLASAMCSFAIITAFITSYVSLRNWD